MSHQGHPRLVNALSKVYSNLLHRDTEIDPQKEVLVTDGAYEVDVIKLFAGNLDLKKWKVLHFHGSESKCYKISFE